MVPHSKHFMFTRFNFIGALSPVGIIVAAVVVLAAIDGYLLARPHAQRQSTTASCLSEQLRAGSTGNCVKDAQTMVDFVETDSLNECPFAGGKTIQPSGTYDAATAAQIKVVQTWLNCYNKQEGGNDMLPTDGVISHATWAALCTYGYQYPHQSQTGSSPYFRQTIAAGKNAGC